MQEWRKTIGRSGGWGGGWRDDFPLDAELPGRVILDLEDLDLPIPAVLLVRLRIFIDWHRSRARRVKVVLPERSSARQLVEAARLADPAIPSGFEGVPSVSGSGPDVVPLTQLTDHVAVEEVARLAREVLEYKLPELAPLGEATYMAVSELCGNALEHGINELGAYVAVIRTAEPRWTVSLAVGDLGIGIPEHVRRQFPEYDDMFAIARALEPGVSGTGDRYRGNGFAETFETALISSASAARLQIHSARGFVQQEVIQGQRPTSGYPAPTFRRGTLISYELVTALA